MNWTSLLNELLQGIITLGVEWPRIIMMIVGGILIWLAIAKEYEPVLLLPIGVGCILANIPLTGMNIGQHHGLFDVLYQGGIVNELFLRSGHKYFSSAGIWGRITPSQHEEG
ncbi:MAG: sodium ion-translocating decarboxylase subunit beta [Firmicutes bacterium]|nr:sodium ion-translocating decarboxylase subunit beta [Bacillota bacterium]